MSEAEPPPDEHEEICALLADYDGGTLAAAEAARVEAHLAGCAACRAEHAEFGSTLAALSGLHKLAAPPALGAEVAETIRRRSGGRFFGRRAFGDRVPFEVLALLALAIGLAVYFAIRSSTTGSFKPFAPSPPLHDDATHVLPRP